MTHDLRIELNDSPIDTVMKMSEGNPGAILALMDLIKNCNRVDPESILSGHLAAVPLDEMGIYGTAIYVLYSDKCGSDIRKFILLLRAVQLGFMSENLLFRMSQDQKREITITEEMFDDLDSQVTSFLVEFKKA